MSKSNPSQTNLNTFVTDDPPRASEPNHSEDEAADENPSTTSTDGSAQPHSPSRPEQPDTDHETASLRDVIEWDTENPGEIGDLEILHAKEPQDVVSLPDDNLFRKGEISLVNGPLEKYFDEFDCQEVTIPPHYTNFESIGVVVTKQTAFSKSGYYGFTPRRFESAIRLIAGKGGFRQEDLSVHVSDDQSALITYDDESYIIAAERVKPPESENYVAETTTIQGMEIPEEDSRLRLALRRFVDLIPTILDLSITGYAKQDGMKHYFNTNHDEKDPIYISGGNLRPFITVVTDPHQLVGDVSVETSFGEEYTAEISASDFDHEVGDDIRMNGTVFGFSRTLEDPRTTAKVNLSSKLKLNLHTHLLSFSGNEIRTSTSTTRIARFDPEQEDPGKIFP